MQGNKPLVRSESIVYDKILEDNDFIALAWKANDRTSLEDMVERLVRAFPNLVKRVSVHVVLPPCDANYQTIVPN